MNAYMKRAKRGVEDSTEALGPAELTWPTFEGLSLLLIQSSFCLFLKAPPFLDLIFANFSYSFLPTFPNPFFTAACDPFFTPPAPQLHVFLRWAPAQSRFQSSEGRVVRTHQRASGGIYPALVFQVLININ